MNNHQVMHIVTSLEVAYQAGLAGKGHLHESFVRIEVANPKLDAGLVVTYGVADTLFGTMLAGITPRGLCWLGFEGSEAAMRARFSGARFVHDNAAISPVFEKFMHIMAPSLRAQPSNPSAGPRDEEPLNLHLFGTEFQIQVWRALLKIPSGQCVSYGDIAAAIGKPLASRAVGSAVGANPLCVLIPCHRVIQKSGALGQYSGGGPVRKKALLAMENQR